MNARERSDRLAALLQDEQRALADFLLDLADFDKRRVWAELGHASLFSYLRRELHLSAGAAQYRKTAELIQRFPEIEDAFRQGRLCLSTVIEVAKVLTPENLAEVLPRFFGLSRREAEMLAAEIRPVAVIPRRDVVTTARTASVGPPPPVQPTTQAAAAPRPPETNCDSVLFRPAEIDAARLTEIPAAAPALALTPVPPARDAVEPLDGEVSRIHLTVPRRLLAKLEAGRDALSHAMPGASTADVVEAALDLLLADRARRKAALVEKPRRSRPPENPATISAEVKRAVWLRAGGRCEFRLASGELCGSTTRLEFDHFEVPKALGGVATAGTIRLHCRPHNLQNARRVFGDPWMDRFTRRGRARGNDEAALDGS